ncbi:hypothetical protein LINPERPRIM_LOCUS6947, partial [Linum perenne]
NYRFLYPVYPLVCVAASAVIESFPDLVKEKHNPNDNSVIVIVYKVLDHYHEVGEVRWIDDGFRGLLPLPFNSSLGGTSAAPPYFNNKNKASDLQYVMFLISSSSPLWICYFLYCN